MKNYSSPLGIPVVKDAETGLSLSSSKFIIISSSKANISKKNY